MLRILGLSSTTCSLSIQHESYVVPAERSKSSHHQCCESKDEEAPPGVMEAARKSPSAAVQHYET